jgi:uncharacterized protein
LVLPGGGFLGLHAAVVLEEIENQLGHSITEHFDLIAGTSIGGIIALGLAAGVRASKIVNLFEDRGPTIFTPRTAPDRFIYKIPKMGKLARLYDEAGNRAIYDPAPLRAAVEEIIGEKTILGEASRYVVIPVLNLTKGGPTVFKTPHHKDFVSDWKLRVTAL